MRQGFSLYQKDKGNAHDLDVYNYAKEVLPSVSEPFSLFIQTYDSHFDGSLNPNCSRNHSEKIFDVYRCVSKEVSDFIDYLKKQSFYNNTTIVIVGDHPNMSKNLTELIPDDYIRSPTVIFINLPFPFKGSKKRNFSTFDLFPTILSSLNVRITNNVLGLGVNLFSNEQTLIEKYGYKLISNSLKKKDDFYNMHFLMGI